MRITNRTLLPVFVVLASARPVAAETLELLLAAHKGYFSERCIELSTGQRLSYELRTPYAVEFNLHHHPHGGETVFPERLRLESHHSNELVAQSSGPYCFMATNLDDRDQPFVLRVSYGVFND
jgi:hypothetical protein